jgi:ubiquinone/menaquinone biosynthesis C-methylase UbiE
MKFLYVLILIQFVNCNDPFSYSSYKAGKSKTDSLNKPEDYNLQEQGQDRTVWQKPYEVIQLLGSLEDKVIADIGAGSGYFAFRFLSEAGKVIAIDIEPELIQLMNQEKSFYKPELQKKFEARLASPNDPKILDKEIDIIFISNTYPLISNRIVYLKNLLPKFKSPGKLMIIDFKKLSTPFGPSLKNRLAQTEVEQELIKAGYKIILSDDSQLEYQYIIIAQPKVKIN